MQSRSKQSHIVFTNGRSGSNFVTDALNQHPEVCNYGEVLGPYMPSMKLHRAVAYGGRSAESYLDFVRTSRLHFELAQRYSALARRRRRQATRPKKWSDITNLGFKDFSIRFIEHDLDDYLLARPELKIVSLHRANTLRRAISLISLQQTGTVSLASPNSRASKQLAIDTTGLIALLDKMQRETDQQLAIVDRIEPQRVLSISYEDMFASDEAPSDHMSQAFSFLEVAPFEITAEHHRVLSPRLSSTISNYDEVFEVVSKSRHAHHLPSVAPNPADNASLSEASKPEAI